MSDFIGRFKVKGNNNTASSGSVMDNILAGLG